MQGQAALMNRSPALCSGCIGEGQAHLVGGRQRGVGGRPGRTPISACQWFVPSLQGLAQRPPLPWHSIKIFNPKVTFCSQMWLLVFATCVSGTGLT